MLSLLVTLIVLVGHGKDVSGSSTDGPGTTVLNEPAPAARSCFKNKPDNLTELQHQQCDAPRRCFIARYTPEKKAEKEYDLEAGCIANQWKTILTDAGFAGKYDKCHLVAAPFEGKEFTFSHICTCNKKNCNSQDLMAKFIEELEDTTTTDAISAATDASISTATAGGEGGQGGGKPYVALVVLLIVCFF